MTFWNFLVVLCFALLYAGLVLVFLQLRRLRDEIRIHHATTKFPEPAFEAPPAPRPSREGVDEGEEEGECTRTVRQGLMEVRAQLLALQEGLREEIPAQILPELEAIQRQLSYVAHSAATAGVVGGGGGAQDNETAYREARLLLANGVDEDRVVDETGLTVEEVSLLRRLMIQQGG